MNLKTAGSEIGKFRWWISTLRASKFLLFQDSWIFKFQDCRTSEFQNSKPSKYRYPVNYIDDLSLWITCVLGSSNERIGFLILSRHAQFLDINVSYVHIYFLSRLCTVISTCDVFNRPTDFNIFVEWKQYDARCSRNNQARTFAVIYRLHADVFRGCWYLCYQGLGLYLWRRLRWPLETRSILESGWPRWRQRRNVVAVWNGGRYSRTSITRISREEFKSSSYESFVPSNCSCNGASPNKYDLILK